jgi:phage baseplate assembly protein W
MTIVHDKIAEYTAELEALVAPPTGDLGYGGDLSCTDDLTADMAELDEHDPLLVAQSNYRRLRTPRGSLPDDPDYGFDLVELLNQGLTVRSAQEIEGQVRGELEKDDRNDMSALTVTVTLSGDLKAFDLDIRSISADAPYTLTLAVTDGGVLLKEIQSNASA